MTKSRKNNDIDAAVGARVKNLRLRRRLSQGELGRQLGVTFQQIQKYESGANRVSAGRLAQLAKFFGMPVAALFSESDDPKSVSRNRSAGRVADDKVTRLVKAFHAMKDSDLKRALLRLVEEMAYQPPDRPRATPSRR
jgi:transcriptional regulator with XRE-family HTH domain